MRVGAYQFPGPNDDSLETDRWVFLCIARQIDLRIMFDLLTGPGQFYHLLLKHYALNTPNGSMTWEQFLAFFPDWKTVEFEAETVALSSHNFFFREMLLFFRGSLLDWSVQWNLDADWCRNRAIEAIRLWGWSKGARLYMCWDLLELWSLVQERLKISDQLCEDEQKFLRELLNDPATFGIKVNSSKPKRRDDLLNVVNSVPRPTSKVLPTVFFPLDSLDDYLKSTRKFLEKHQSLSTFTNAKRRRSISKILNGPARAYYKQVERHFRNLGWKQARQQPECLKQLTWAVLYQVLGVECDRIAAGPPIVEATAVSQSISRVLKQLGLPSRRAPGRPPKATS